RERPDRETDRPAGETRSLPSQDAAGDDQDGGSLAFTGLALAGLLAGGLTLLAAGATLRRRL
nr:hypothetical protein [Thermoleophilaceae bacterium]